MNSMKIKKRLLLLISPSLISPKGRRLHAQTKLRSQPFGCLREGCGGLNSNRILVILIVSILMSGCFVFRPKNKCNDCPTWNKHGHAQKASASALHV